MCLCGDTECPSCGTAQGTYHGRFTAEELMHRCPDCRELCDCSGIENCEHQCECPSCE